MRLKNLTVVSMYDLSGIERQADEPFHPVPAFRLAEPDRLAAVGILGQRVVDRHESRVAVVMERAPFHAAGDPRPEHADQRRLDDVLAVEEVVVVGLVDRRKQPPADLRQDRQLEEVVFENERGVFLVDLRVGQVILQGVGVDPLLGPLVRLVGIEHRVRIGRPDPVGGNHDLLFGDANRPFIAEGSTQTGEQAHGKDADNRSLAASRWGGSSWSHFLLNGSSWSHLHSKS